MSDDTPRGGDPRDFGGETPADGAPPPPYPPPPPPGGDDGAGYGSGYAADGPGGYQEWPHEAPPGVGQGPAPRHKDPRAVSRGVKAAALIFAAACVLHLITLAAVAVSGDSSNAGYFLVEGLFVVVAGFVAALIITTRLPMDSRAPFWISGLAFMALSFIVWGVTCGIGFSVSPLNMH